MSRASLPAAAFAAVLALVAVDASAGDPVGTTFGNWKATASIATIDGEPDVDDYVAPMLKGESLTCTVASAAKSALVPDVKLLDPTGADRTPQLTSTKAGKSLAFKAFPIDASGRWTLRVTGAGGTEGAYTAAFKIKAVTKFGGKGLLGGSFPLVAPVGFEATRGAKITLTLRPVGKGDVSVKSFLDPTGTSSAALLGALQVKRGVSTLKNVEIGGPSGTYTVNVATTTAAKYFLDVRMTVVPRAKGGSKHSAKEPRLAAVSPPQRVAARLPAAFVGHDFSKKPLPHVFVGGVDAGPATLSADGTTATVVVPDLLAGSTADVAVQNGDGQTFVRVGNAYVVPAPVATALRDASSATITRGGVAGGEPFDLLGSGFDAYTKVRFGDVEATVAQVVDAGLLKIVSPAHVRGTVIVSVVDDFGRTSDLPTSFRYVLPDWGEGDSPRLPAQSAADDYSAARAAVGELGGGRGGDVVLATPLRTFEDGSATHGTRLVQTRVLRQDAAGDLADVTDAKFPAARSMAFPYDLDDWNADALAVGDLDGAGGNDVIVAGFSEVTSDGFVGGFSYGQNLFASGVRALRNDGTGRLALSPADQDKPQRRRPALTALDDGGTPRPILGPFGEDRGDPTAVAVGDLDGDGAPDLVVAHAEFGFRRVLQNLAHVDFSANPLTIPTADADAFVLGVDRTTAYVAGTEILRNKLRTGGPLVNVTETSMPLSFADDLTPDGPTLPGYQADDVALGDVNGDGKTDIVLVWHDPTTVSVRGLKTSLQSVYDGVNPPVSLDAPRVATRVLLNDGKGRFADATAQWMPPGAAFEWWQGDRIALTDLDGDAAPDLVVLSRAGVEAWTATAVSPVATTLVSGSNPGDLAAGETESYAFTVASDGRYVMEVALGTLTDSMLTLVAPGGGVVAFDDDGGEGFGSRIVRDLTPGIWTARVTGWSGVDAGTFLLSVSGRPAAPPATPRAHSALRVLRCDRTNSKFVDVTATAVPALPVGDDFRGGALKVGDADKDGVPDIVIATTEQLFGTGGARVSSLRVLRGGAGPAFAFDAAAVPPTSIDTGEAEDVQFVPAPTAGSPPSLLLVSRVQPSTSQGGRFTRLFDWSR